jgi:hypothetical protein
MNINNKQLKILFLDVLPTSWVFTKKIKISVWCTILNDKSNAFLLNIYELTRKYKVINVTENVILKH